MLSNDQSAHMTSSHIIGQESGPQVDKRNGQIHTSALSRYLAALLASVCLAGCAAIKDQHEPTYQGRTLSDWTRDIDPHGGSLVGHEPLAFTAISQIGTNAIPTLLKWLSERDPPEPLKPGLASCFTMPRSARAGFAFCILADKARPAIPNLVQIARRSSDVTRSDLCAIALASIGPEALPSLLSLATNATPETRRCAIYALLRLPDNQSALPAVPVLINSFADKDVTAADIAADILHRLSLPATIVIPALTNAMRSSSAPIRMRAVRCLGWHHEDAVSAIPLFRAAMRDPDFGVRATATNVLRGMGGWQVASDGRWVRRRGTNILHGITSDFFSDAPDSNPQGGANGSQLVHPETNRTPAAAASRRSP